jgi:hypothetical protein
VAFRPKEKRTFPIESTIEHPPTLVLEMRRNEAMQPPATSPSAPARATKRPSFDVKSDIEPFEQLF